MFKLASIILLTGALAACGEDAALESGNVLTGEEVQIENNVADTTLESATDATQEVTEQVQEVIEQAEESTTTPEDVLATGTLSE